MVSMKIQRLFSPLPGDNFSIAVELYILIILYNLSLRAVDYRISTVSIVKLKNFSPQLLTKKYSVSLIL